MAGERILIVDDQKEAARLIRKNLESLQQNLIIEDVLSGEEALLELVRGNTDLLVADFLLPGISGLELMDKFKAHNENAKVILISGVTDPKIRQKVAQAGADAFFFKPIDVPEFLDAVERALGFVETSLPSELSLHAAELEEISAEQTHINMTDQITQLRVSLDATSVMLVGDQGQVLVRAGDLPDPNLETSLMPMLMRTFNAGVRISHFLGQNIPNHFYNFRGENYDLFLSPVGDAYCLMILTRPTLLQEMGSIAKQVNNTAKSVHLSLSRLGFSTHATGQLNPPAKEPSIESNPTVPRDQYSAPDSQESPPPETGSLSAEEDLSSDQNLESLIAAAEQEQIQDADAFWETFSSEEINPELSNKDSLSYDQAAKLGLAPNED